MPLRMVSGRELIKFDRLSLDLYTPVGKLAPADPMLPTQSRQMKKGGEITDADGEKMVDNLSSCESN